jgi:hypothetical protein
MKPVLLYRPSLMESDELEAAQQAGFPCVSQRSQVPPRSLVVARYSALPFYRELEADLREQGSRLVNTSRQHEWVANMDWAFEPLTIGLTFPTWTDLSQVPRDEAPFVLKGRTNSKKQRWSNMMFAASWDEAQAVQARLLDDGLIGDQGVVIRKYVPLHTYFEAIGGLPITTEFRAFILDGQLLSVAYYWHAFVDDFPFYNQTPPSVNEIDTGFLQTVIDRVGDSARFYVADIARDQTGKWWLVEINDGQQSGLSGNSPTTLYRALYRMLTEPRE